MENLKIWISENATEWVIQIAIAIAIFVVGKFIARQLIQVGFGFKDCRLGLKANPGFNHANAISVIEFWNEQQGPHTAFTIIVR